VRVAARRADAARGAARAAWLALLLLLAACRAPPAAPFGPDEFWGVVGSMRGATGEEDARARLAGRLAQLPEPHLVAFRSHYDAAVAAADRGDVWAAGRLANGGHATDDGFQYFREWLVAQGREVYERTLAAPDTLADFPFADEPGSRAEWEGLAFEAVRVYEARTGRDFPRLTGSPAARFALPDWDGRDYTHAVLAQRLPRLWARYGAELQAWERQFEPGGSVPPAHAVPDGP
jgi:hypothetical protein